MGSQEGRVEYRGSLQLERISRRVVEPPPRKLTGERPDRGRDRENHRRSAVDRRNADG